MNLQFSGIFVLHLNNTFMLISAVSLHISQGILSLVILPTFLLFLSFINSNSLSQNVSASQQMLFLFQSHNSDQSAVVFLYLVLKLQDGTNEIVFQADTNFQGTGGNFLDQETQFQFKFDSRFKRARTQRHTL